MLIDEFRNLLTLSDVKSIRVFGSYARNDNDNYSDKDVLIVVSNDSNIREITKEAKKLNNFTCSFYGEKRLTEYFSKGHLFAWHLYYESNKISLNTDLLDELGEPQPYITFKEDSEILIKLFDSVELNLKNNTLNKIFELGLLYLICRNIAMIATSVFINRPCFTRYSPYILESSGIKFSLARPEYDILILARMASKRGFPPPVIDSIDAINIISIIRDWIERVSVKLKGATNERQIF